MKRKLALLLLLLFILILFSLSVGSSGLSLVDLFRGDKMARFILVELRFPRLVATLFCGSAFAVAGLLIQVATGNELASPNIIGVNAGAGFLVLLTLSFFPHLFAFLPLMAFLGATLAVFLVLALASVVKGEHKKGSLILAGVALNAFINALINSLSILYPEVLSTYASFQLGGFSGIYRDVLVLPVVLICVALLLTSRRLHDLTLLTYGDEMASSLGVEVTKTRTFALLLAALLSASSVSLCGLLGFVGLLVPHMARYLVGEDVKKRFLLSILLGSMLVLLSDTLGRILIAPGELPAGIFLSLFGAPFFLYLLARRHR